MAPASSSDPLAPEKHTNIGRRPTLPPRSRSRSPIFFFGGEPASPSGCHPVGALLSTCAPVSMITSKLSLQYYYLPGQAPSSTRHAGGTGEVRPNSTRVRKQWCMHRARAAILLPCSFRSLSFPCAVCPAELTNNPAQDGRWQLSFPITLSYKTERPCAGRASIICTCSRVCSPRALCSHGRTSASFVLPISLPSALPCRRA